MSFSVVDNRGCLGFFVCLLVWRNVLEIKKCITFLIHFLLYTTEKNLNLKKSIEMETCIYNKAKAAEDQIKMSQPM